MLAYNTALSNAASAMLMCCTSLTEVQLTGNRPPERPKFQQETAMQAFDGVLAERHKTKDGSAEYVHIIFGSPQADSARSDIKAAGVIDAEFLFLTGECHRCCCRFCR